MGIMDIFRTTAGNTNSAQPAANGGQSGMAGQGFIQNNQNQGGAGPSQQTGGNNNPANAIVPGSAPGQSGTVTNVDNGIPRNTDKQALTIDSFNDIWKQPEQEGQPKPDPSQFRRQKLDMTKIDAAVKNMNFTANLDPAMVQKALSGDAQAFMQVINQVAQEGFRTSFNATESYQGRILDQYDQSVNARIPKQINNLESQQLIQQNTTLSHPAIMPVVELVRNQLRERYPDASPKDIADTADAYFRQAAAHVNTNQSESGLQIGTQANGSGQSQFRKTAKNSNVVSDFEGFENLH